MKKILFCVLVLFSAGACKKSSTSPTVNNSIVGKWKMTEYFFDTGDGNAKFRPVDPLNISYIEFKADGSMIMTPNDLYSANHYEITSDSTMDLGVDPEKYSLHYELSPGMLTIHGPCYVPCAQRFVPSDK
jgi:hypothetical protein